MSLTRDETADMVAEMLRHVVSVAEDWHRVQHHVVFKDKITYVEEGTNTRHRKIVARFHKSHFFGSLFFDIEDSQIKKGVDVLKATMVGKWGGLSYRESGWFTYEMPDSALSHTIYLNPKKVWTDERVRFGTKC